METGTDQIEQIVDQAHKIFNKTSVLEVIDMDGDSARDFLNKAYGHPEPAIIDLYLDVIEMLRWIAK